VWCTEDHTPAWPHPARRDLLWLGQSSRGHTPALTASSRTTPRGIACGSQWPLSRTRAAERRAAPDPKSGIRCGWGGFKGLNVFLNSRKWFFPLKNPRKSILSPKIVKPLPENF
jgi:hypothetical protein